MGDHAKGYTDNVEGESVTESAQPQKDFPLEDSMPKRRGSFRIDPLHGGVASSPMAAPRLREGESYAYSVNQRADKREVRCSPDIGPYDPRRHPVRFVWPQSPVDG